MAIIMDCISVGMNNQNNKNAVFSHAATKRETFEYEMGEIHENFTSKKMEVDEILKIYKNPCLMARIRACYDKNNHLMAELIEKDIVMLNNNNFNPLAELICQRMLNSTNRLVIYKFV